MRLYCRIVLCILCLLLGLLPGLWLSAQDAPLAPGDIVEAALAAGETHRYQLRVLELTLISLRMEALAPSLDPVIEVYNSSGELVIKNDDYAYPDQLDAVIQAFITPRTDVYTIEVSGFGDTAGDYRLLAMPGYDSLAGRDSTMAAADWEVVFSDAPFTRLADDRLSLRIEGLSKSVSLLGRHFPIERDLYFEATFDDVIAAANWQAGILFRYVSAESHYRLLVSKRGYWRLERAQGESAVVVRNWSTHPAIAPGETSFRLGVLASGQLFDVVYNGQVVGTVIDDQIKAAAGGVGITARTADALGSRVSFAVTETTMTAPTRIDGKPLFPQHIPAGNYTATANLLARQQVIPAEGAAKLTVPQSRVRNTPPGITRFPVASGASFAEFVIGADLRYEMRAAAKGGCGLIFHYADGENYTLAYVDADGEYGVSRRQGDAFQPGLFGGGLSPAPNEHKLLLLVYGGRLDYYIDGWHVGAMTYPPQSGELGTAVVNFEAVDTNCVFEDLWLWSLDETAP